MLRQNRPNLSKNWWIQLIVILDVKQTTEVCKIIKTSNEVMDFLQNQERYIIRFMN